MMIMYKPVALLLALLALVNGQEVANKMGSSQEEETEVQEGSGEGGAKRGDTTFPNIGYLFKGYNIILGNPMADRHDPGFVSPIFKAEFNKDRRTADQTHKIPDNADVIAKTACSESLSIDTIMTESQYQRDLSAKAFASASGQIDFLKASFTANSEYREISKQLKSNKNLIIKNEAVCIVYAARIQTGTPPPVTDNFREFVRRMSRERNYPDFLDTFGTHFVESVDMGARFTRLDEISKKKQEDLKSNGFNLRRAAEVSVLGLGNVSTDSEFGISTEDSKTYEKSLENNRKAVIGSDLPKDGSIENWKAASAKSPMPVIYHLRSITELFNGNYFNIDGVDVRSVGQELLEALQGYCNVLKSNRFLDADCEGPPKGCGGGSQCSANAKCTDTTESGDEDNRYTCVCKKDFIGDGQTCEKELLGIPSGDIHQDDNRMDYGTWGGMDLCTKGKFAKGFTIKLDEAQGTGDDTAANAVCLACDETEEQCSKKGQWGDWSEMYECPTGSYLAGWRQNVEEDKGWGLLADDTGLNNVEYECRDLENWKVTEKLDGKGPSWGRWSKFKRCPRGQFICGLNTRVAPHYYDDTALNDIIHKCCKPRFPAKKMAKIFKMMKSKQKAAKVKKEKTMKLKAEKH